jgi:predicted nucleic acid-binding Zn ribbon protein
MQIARTERIIALATRKMKSANTEKILFTKMMLMSNISNLKSNKNQKRKKRNNMVLFGAGMFVGIIIGIVVMCVLTIAD